MYNTTITNQYHRKRIDLVATPGQKVALASGNYWPEIKAALADMGFHDTSNGSDGDLLRNSPIMALYDTYPNPLRRTFNDEISIAEENSFWYMWHMASYKHQHGDRALYDYYRNQAISHRMVKYLPTFDEYKAFFNNLKKTSHAALHDNMFHENYLQGKIRR